MFNKRPLFWHPLGWPNDVQSLAMCCVGTIRKTSSEQLTFACLYVHVRPVYLFAICIYNQWIFRSDFLILLYSNNIILWAQIAIMSRSHHHFISLSPICIKTRTSSDYGSFRWHFINSYWILVMVYQLEFYLLLPQRKAMSWWIKIFSTLLFKRWEMFLY